MIQAVIFNIDGVIADTDEYHYRSWKSVAEEEGIPFDRSVYNQMRGTNRMDCVALMAKRANKNYTEEEKIAISDKKNAIYQNFLTQLTEMDCPEEVRSTVEFLKKNGIKVAIGTASTNCETILSKIKMEHVFDVVVDGNDVDVARHDSVIFDKIAKALALSPKDILVVEDGFSAIKAAKEGGYKTAGVKEAASYYQTDYPLVTISDILPILKKENKLN
ncbi:MAG: HAD hydrolase-like protein [Bacilli bacterium]|jgi:beta-phosphoglucomutase|nr:HAD hydrolase-like protein [Bacilli bacterium]